MLRHALRTVARSSARASTWPVAARSFASASNTPRFNWQDPLASRNLLTEEELAIQETAERYCQERLLPRVLQAYRDEYYDPKILQEMGELGLLGANIEGYGCAGVSSVAGSLITRAVERVDSGYRSGMSVQSSLVMGGIFEFGTEEQKEKFLPDMAKGKLLGAFGLTEPNHGSDPGSMESFAKPHPTKKGFYSLSGSKTWITNSPIADVLLVWAKLQETGKIRGFLIERKDCPPGSLETPAIKDKNGLRASITGMIQMDECPVPEANMFPEVEGLKGPFSCLNSARYGISMGVMGALEDSIARARTYALERKQFKGNPLARYQLIQKKLADAATDASYGVLASIQVGRLKDEGKATPEMISMVKRQNCDTALRNARILQEIFGGNAVSDEYAIGRHVANLFVTQTYEGQSDIHSLFPPSLPIGLGLGTNLSDIMRRSYSGPGHHGHPGLCLAGWTGAPKRKAQAIDEAMSNRTLSTFALGDLMARTTLRRAERHATRLSVSRKMENKMNESSRCFMAVSHALAVTSSSALTLARKYMQDDGSWRLPRNRNDGIAGRPEWRTAMIARRVFSLQAVFLQADSKYSVFLPWPAHSPSASSAVTAVVQSDAKLCSVMGVVVFGDRSYSTEEASVGLSMEAQRRSWQPAC
ncbi:glutaryl-CoA dehydrogenase [Drechmeria coniospora]|uniref:Glutaryl-CoA dehydrogenase n=1 Tax=Drechmeria coniospora TaxID=98403 RepID=A0A151GC91_DRECN|nr:glutaryl-CoA dehydrogenase [Drechmeria coniospora]KYK54727.1 glutaryl-CoA dehydrogenase [Drechmeria coniospora]